VRIFQKKFFLSSINLLQEVHLHILDRKFYFKILWNFIFGCGFNTEMSRKETNSQG